jgi:hypothetical protein
MQNVLGVPTRIVITALILGAMALGSTVTFRAPGPGLPLQPLGGAVDVIRLVQGEQSILWTALEGDVDTYRVQGWPVGSGGVELGGAVMIERVSGDAGIVAFGERPMTLEFQMAG